MSVSCVGTCTHCGVHRFWLSCTLSLQTDDGRLHCLPHPGEGGSCKRYGLTLGQASGRGRLYREIYYVCRACGRDGEVIVGLDRFEDWDARRLLSLRREMTWGWGAAAVVVPLFVWQQWWDAAAVLGGTLLLWPAMSWRDHRRWAKQEGLVGLPRADAPGGRPIAAPVAGCRDDIEVVLGRVVEEHAVEPKAVGACCGSPDWMPAYRVRDEDRIPCCACGRGVMVTSEHAIH